MLSKSKNHTLTQFAEKRGGWSLMVVGFSFFVRFFFTLEKLITLSKCKNLCVAVVFNIFFSTVLLTLSVYCVCFQFIEHDSIVVLINKTRYFIYINTNTHTHKRENER